MLEDCMKWALLPILPLFVSYARWPDLPPPLAPRILSSLCTKTLYAHWVQARHVHVHSFPQPKNLCSPGNTARRPRFPCFARIRWYPPSIGSMTDCLTNLTWYKVWRIHIRNTIFCEGSKSIKITWSPFPALFGIAPLPLLVCPPLIEAQAIFYWTPSNNFWSSEGISRSSGPYFPFGSWASPAPSSHATRIQCWLASVPLIFAWSCATAAAISHSRLEASSRRFFWRTWLLIIWNYRVFIKLDYL